MCSASGLTPAQGASPSCGWPPVVAARDRARRSGRAGVSPSTQEPDLRIGGRGRACRRRRVRPVRQEVAVVHQSWLLSHVRGINGRVRCSDLRERWKSTVVGWGHADGGVRSANYTHKFPVQMPSKSCLEAPRSMVRTFSSKGTAAGQVTHGVLRVAPSLARAGEPVSHIPGQGSEDL
jgi:hypothetical protein